MGLDINSLNFLGYAKSSGVNFTKTLSVGRAGISLEEQEIKSFLHRIGKKEFIKDTSSLVETKYFEPILKEVFGAEITDSLDASDYENASMIHDLNLSLKVERKFTAILDFGCLEHVFNLPVAIDNLINSCEVNGHILHYLPANNCCGHGFYQFSPELFFSLYSSERGFSDTQIFFVEWQDDPETWYQINSPSELHSRVNIVNKAEGYLLVKTKKLANAMSPLDLAPQQSDYVEWWKSGEESVQIGEGFYYSLKQFTKATLRLIGGRKLIKKISLSLWYRSKQVKNKRSDLTKHQVVDLIQS